MTAPWEGGKLYNLVPQPGLDSSALLTQDTYGSALDAVLYDFLSEEERETFGRAERQQWEQAINKQLMELSEGTDITAETLRILMPEAKAAIDRANSLTSAPSRAIEGAEMQIANLKGMWGASGYGKVANSVLENVGLKVRRDQLFRDSDIGVFTDAMEDGDYPEDVVAKWTGALQSAAENGNMTLGEVQDQFVEASLKKMHTSLKESLQSMAEDSEVANLDMLRFMEIVEREDLNEVEKMVEVTEMVARTPGSLFKNTVGVFADSAFPMASTATAAGAMSKLLGRFGGPWGKAVNILGRGAAAAGVTFPMEKASKYMEFIGKSNIGEMSDEQFAAFVTSDAYQEGVEEATKNAGIITAGVAMSTGIAGIYSNASRAALQKRIFKRLEGAVKAEGKALTDDAVAALAKKTGRDWAGQVGAEALEQLTQVGIDSGAAYIAEGGGAAVLEALGEFGGTLSGSAYRWGKNSLPSQRLKRQDQLTEYHKSLTEVSEVIAEVVKVEAEQQAAANFNASWSASMNLGQNLNHIDNFFVGVVGMQQEGQPLEQPTSPTMSQPAQQVMGQFGTGTETKKGEWNANWRVVANLPTAADSWQLEGKGAENASGIQFGGEYTVGVTNRPTVVSHSSKAFANSLDVLVRDLQSAEGADSKFKWSVERDRTNPDAVLLSYTNADGRTYSAQLSFEMNKENGTVQARVNTTESSEEIGSPLNQAALSNANSIGARIIANLTDLRVTHQRHPLERDGGETAWIVSTEEQAPNPRIDGFWTEYVMPTSNLGGAENTRSGGMMRNQRVSPNGLLTADETRAWFKSRIDVANAHIDLLNKQKASLNEIVQTGKIDLVKKYSPKSYTQLERSLAALDERVAQGEITEGSDTYEALRREAIENAFNATRELVGTTGRDGVELSDEFFTDIGRVSANADALVTLEQNLKVLNEYMNTPALQGGVDGAVAKWQGAVVESVLEQSNQWVEVALPELVPESAGKDVMKGWDDVEGGRTLRLVYHEETGELRGVGIDGSVLHLKEVKRSDVGISRDAQAVAKQANDRNDKGNIKTKHLKGKGRVAELRKIAQSMGLVEAQYRSQEKGGKKTNEEARVLMDAIAKEVEARRTMQKTTEKDATVLVANGVNGFEVGGSAGMVIGALTTPLNYAAVVDNGIVTPASPQPVSKEQAAAPKAKAQPDVVPRLGDPATPYLDSADFKDALNLRGDVDLQREDTDRELADVVDFDQMLKGRYKKFATIAKKLGYAPPEDLYISEAYALASEAYAQGLIRDLDDIGLRLPKQANTEGVRSKLVSGSEAESEVVNASVADRLTETLKERRGKLNARHWNKNVIADLVVAYIAHVRKSSLTLDGTVDQATIEKKMITVDELVYFLETYAGTIEGAVEQRMAETKGLDKRATRVAEALAILKQTLGRGVADRRSQIEQAKESAQLRKEYELAKSVISDQRIRELARDMAARKREESVPVQSPLSLRGDSIPVWLQEIDTPVARDRQQLEAFWFETAEKINRLTPALEAELQQLTDPATAEALVEDVLAYIQKSLELSIKEDQQKARSIGSVLADERRTGKRLNKAAASAMKLGMLKLEQDGSISDEQYFEAVDEWVGMMIDDRAGEGSNAAPERRALEQVLNTYKNLVRKARRQGKEPPPPEIMLEELRSQLLAADPNASMDERMAAELERTGDGLRSPGQKSASGPGGKALRKLNTELLTSAFEAGRSVEDILERLSAQGGLDQLVGGPVFENIVEVKGDRLDNLQALRAFNEILSLNKVDQNTIRDVLTRYGLVEDNQLTKKGKLHLATIGKMVTSSQQNLSGDMVFTLPAVQEWIEKSGEGKAEVNKAAQEGVVLDALNELQTAVYVIRENLNLELQPYLEAKAVQELGVQAAKALQAKVAPQLGATAEVTPDSPAPRAADAFEGILEDQRLAAIEQNIARTLKEGIRPSTKWRQIQTLKDTQWTGEQQPTPWRGAEEEFTSLFKTDNDTINKVLGRTAQNADGPVPLSYSQRVERMILGNRAPEIPNETQVDENGESNTTITLAESVDKKPVGRWQRRWNGIWTAVRAQGTVLKNQFGKGTDVSELEGIIAQYARSGYAVADAMTAHFSRENAELERIIKAEVDTREGRAALRRKTRELWEGIEHKDVPEAIVNWVNRNRADVDALRQDLVNSGFLPPELISIFNDKGEFKLHQSMTPHISTWGAIAALAGAVTGQSARVTDAKQIVKLMGKDKMIEHVKELYNLDSADLSLSKDLLLLGAIQGIYGDTVKAEVLTVQPTSKWSTDKLRMLIKEKGQPGQDTAWGEVVTSYVRLLTEKLDAPDNRGTTAHMKVSNSFKLKNKTLKSTFERQEEVVRELLRDSVFKSRFGKDASREQILQELEKFEGLNGLASLPEQEFVELFRRIADVLQEKFPDGGYERFFPIFQGIKKSSDLEGSVWEAVGQDTGVGVALVETAAQLAGTRESSVFVSSVLQWAMDNGLATVDKMRAKDGWQNPLYFKGDEGTTQIDGLARTPIRLKMADGQLSQPMTLSNMNNLNVVDKKTKKRGDNVAIYVDPAVAMLIHEQIGVVEDKQTGLSRFARAMSYLLKTGVTTRSPTAWFRNAISALWDVPFRLGTQRESVEALATGWTNEATRVTGVDRLIEVGVTPTQVLAEAVGIRGTGQGVGNLRAIGRAMSQTSTLDPSISPELMYRSRDDESFETRADRYRDRANRFGKAAGAVAETLFRIGDDGPRSGALVHKTMQILLAEQGYWSVGLARYGKGKGNKAFKKVESDLEMLAAILGGQSEGGLQTLNMVKRDHPELASTVEALQVASTYVQAVTPTYHRAFRALQKLSRGLFILPFSVFSGEVLRNQWNQFSIATNMMRTGNRFDGSAAVNEKETAANRFEGTMSLSRLAAYDAASISMVGGAGMAAKTLGTWLLGGVSGLLGFGIDDEEERNVDPRLRDPAVESNAQVVAGGGFGRHTINNIDPATGSYTVTDPSTTIAQGGAIRAAGDMLEGMQEGIELAQRGQYEKGAKQFFIGSLRAANMFILPEILWSEVIESYADNLRDLERQGYAGDETATQIQAFTSTGIEAGLSVAAAGWMPTIKFLQTLTPVNIVGEKDYDAQLAEEQYEAVVMGRITGQSARPSSVQKDLYGYLVFSGSDVRRTTQHKLGLALADPDLTQKELYDLMSELGAKGNMYAERFSDYITFMGVKGNISEQTIINMMDEHLRNEVGIEDGFRTWLRREGLDWAKMRQGIMPLGEALERQSWAAVKRLDTGISKEQFEANLEMATLYQLTVDPTQWSGRTSGARPTPSFRQTDALAGIEETLGQGNSGNASATPSGTIVGGSGRPSLTRQGPNGTVDVWTGDAAIEKVAAIEGIPASQIPEKYKEIIREEGFSDDPYFDPADPSNLNKITQYAGQTGSYRKMSPLTAMQAKEADVRGFTNNYDNLPMELQTALLSSHYRGSWSPTGKGGSPDAIELFNAGRYDEAAAEFLNRDEYRNTTLRGIRNRLERTAEAIRAYGRSQRQSLLTGRNP